MFYFCLEIAKKKMLNKISTKELQEKGVALNNSIMERCWVQYSLTSNQQQQQQQQNPAFSFKKKKLKWGTWKLQWKI